MLYCCLHWSSSLMVLILVTSAACRHEILNSQNWVQQAQQSTTLNRGWSSSADRELDSARCTGLGTAQVCCAACLLRKVEMGRYCSRFLGSILTPPPLVFFFQHHFCFEKNAANNWTQCCHEQLWPAVLRGKLETCLPEQLINFVYCSTVKSSKCVCSSHHGATAFSRTKGRWSWATDLQPVSASPPALST